MNIDVLIDCLDYLADKGIDVLEACMDLFLLFLDHGVKGV